MLVDQNDARRATRPPAVVGTAGAVGYLAVALIQAVDPIGPGAPGFAFRNAVSIASTVLLIGVVVGLARTGAAGRTVPARIGLATVAAGWVMIVGAQMAVQLRGGEITALFVVATLLHVLGMITVGVAVLRGDAWSGPRRCAPLLCGVYLVAAMPLLGSPGAVGHLAIAGWAACWLLLGLAVVASTTRPGAP